MAATSVGVLASLAGRAKDLLQRGDRTASKALEADIRAWVKAWNASVSGHGGFLLSDAASWVTGADFVIDWGDTAR